MPADQPPAIIMPAEIQLGPIMLKDFRSLPESEQERLAVLAGNAQFVLRMTDGIKPDTEVGKSIIIIRKTLTRGLSQ